MSATFRVIKPTAVEDKVWEAVEAAIDDGWTPEKLLREIRQDWQDYLRTKAKDDDKAFDRRPI